MAADKPKYGCIDYDALKAKYGTPEEMAHRTAPKFWGQATPHYIPAQRANPPQAKSTNLSDALRPNCYERTIEMSTQQATRRKTERQEHSQAIREGRTAQSPLEVLVCRSQRTRANQKLVRHDRQSG